MVDVVILEDEWLSSTLMVERWLINGWSAAGNYGRLAYGWSIIDQPLISGIYPLINSHNYRTSWFFIGTSTINGIFSIVLLKFTLENGHFNHSYLNWPVRVHPVSSTFLLPSKWGSSQWPRGAQPLGCSEIWRLRSEC